MQAVNSEKQVRDRGLQLKNLSQLANRQTTISNYLAKNNISSFLYIFAIQDNKFTQTKLSKTEVFYNNKLAGLFFIPLVLGLKTFISCLFIYSFALLCFACSVLHSRLAITGHKAELDFFSHLRTFTDPLVALPSST